MAIVEFKAVNKVYPAAKGHEPFQAVKSIDLAVRDKEFMVLVGPSGCGKSTSLRMLAGLESITSGEIRIDGLPVNNLPPKSRDVAMVFQNYALYPHMTVYENLSFGLRMQKTPKATIDDKVKEAADILGLTELLSRKPKALSGGQRQRVALGRAIVRHPKVFLFDEPLSNLDAKMRVQMRTEIIKLHQRLEATMIYVTHDQVEAMTMGDRICVMNEGEIMQVDTPMGLYRNPANRFVASFIGSPPMNLFSVSITSQKKSSVFSLGKSTFSLPAPLHSKIASLDMKQVILGIRPEDWVVLPQGDNGFKVTVDGIEPLGPETLITFAHEGSTMVVKVSPELDLRPGDTIHLDLKPEKLHCFDPTPTGATLSPLPPA